MGRQTEKPPEGYLTDSQAAQALGISLTRVRRLRAKRELPIWRSPENGAVWVEEIALRDALMEEEEVEGATTKHELRTLVGESLYRARRAEKELERLHSFLGLDAPRLPTSEVEIQGLLEEARRLIQRVPCVVPTEELFAWARRFMAMNEYFLSLVAHCTGQPEPWKVFLQLSTKLLWEIPEGELKKSYELMNAWAGLQAGQKNLRQAAYIYEVSEYGKARTEKVFPELCQREVDALFDTYLGIYKTPVLS